MIGETRPNVIVLAAAIAIGLNRGRNQTILVYDLGGGTFDVSILQVQGNTFTVKAVNGNHDLGGNDFDGEMAERYGYVNRALPDAELQVLPGVGHMVTTERPDVVAAALRRLLAHARPPG